MNLKDTIQLVDDFKWRMSRNAAMLRRQNGRFIRKQEKRLQKNLQSIFERQMNWTVKNLKNLPAFNSLKTNSLEDDVDDLLDKMPGKNSMVEKILFFSRITMDKGGKTTVKELGLKEFGISFDIKHPEAVKFLKEKSLLELSNSKGNIDFNTKKRIREIIIDKVANGRSYTETADSIMAQGDAGVFSRARAELIAVRESAYAYETGKKIPMDDFVKENPDREVVKYWQTVNDENVTPECAENELASPIGFKEYFPNDGNQDIAPRDGNPRCRCHVSYEIL